MVQIEAIVAVDQRIGLAKNGQIPWKSKTDMTFFKTQTTNHIIVMGINTLLSLRNANPLPNRLNIVLTRNPEKYNTDNNENNNNNTNKYKKMDNILFMNNQSFTQFISDPASIVTPEHNKYLNKDYKIFIIGGEQIYTQFCDMCDTIWLTKIKANYECDLIFSYYSRLFDTDAKKYNCEIYYDDDELEIIRLTKTRIQADSLMK
jgi:dihydrofolate reductase